MFAVISASSGRQQSRTKAFKANRQQKYNVCFLDGTHENFELLKSYDVIEWNGGKARQIYKNLYHLMRGQIYEIEGLKIFTMGGGGEPGYRHSFR